MENKNNNKLAKGIIAAGAGLTTAALHELLLSKKEHDKKEREINRVEKEKDKYMKKIGTYEPFDVDKGNVTADDSKLVNLLTRAVGVAFSDNDVFTRNKSNIRTFPFIISNNSSINATVEVELRKYYELMVAAQVANMINHTVFSAENILNVKDKDKRTVDKIMDKILPGQMDFGTALQKGLYENYLFESGNNIKTLTESYEDMYPTIDQYLNDYQRVLRTYVHNAGEKQRLAKDMQNIKEARKDALKLRKTFSKLDYSLNPGAVLSLAEQKTEKDIKDLLSGRLARSFDGLESEDVLSDMRNITLNDFNNSKIHYVKGKDIVTNVLEYLTELSNYHTLLGRGITIIANNNFSEPDKNLADADPYFRLLDLPRVDNYVDSAQMIMRMFKNSNTMKVKLEMAAALLISTEILPYEFIEYATKYLGLPMHEKTKVAITMKYGMGTKDSPFRFMGNTYVMSSKKDVMDFYGEMRPSEFVDAKDLVKKLSRNQLRANQWSFFDFLRNRQKLEQRWITRHGSKIDKQLAALYASSKKIDDRKKINAIDKQIMDQSKKMYSGIENIAKSITRNKTTGVRADMLYGKSLSMLGAGGARVHKIIEDRLKNKIVDLFSVKDVDKSLEYFLDPTQASNNPEYDPTATFRPNLMQTQKLIQSIMTEGFEDQADVTVLSEELIFGLTEKAIEESYVRDVNLNQPYRRVIQREVEKDPIEYVLPAYTKGRSLLYGSTEIDTDQFKNRKVGEPIWIKVTFSDKINSMKSDVTDNDFTTVIGIKSEVHRVPEKEVEKVLRNPSSNVPNLASIFRKQKAQSLGLLSKIANENDLKSANLNGILIVSMNEATSNISSKPSDDYINNPRLAKALRKTYNLTSICLVDAIAEEYYIMEENSSSWSRMPFSELRSSGTNSDIKALASIMNAGRR